MNCWLEIKFNRFKKVALFFSFWLKNVLEWFWCHLVVPHTHQANIESYKNEYLLHNCVSEVWAIFLLNQTHGATRSCARYLHFRLTNPISLANCSKACSGIFHCNSLEIIVTRQKSVESYKNAILFYDSTEKIAYFFILRKFCFASLIAMWRTLKKEVSFFWKNE